LYPSVRGAHRAMSTAAPADRKEPACPLRLKPEKPHAGYMSSGIAPIADVRELRWDFRDWAGRRHSVRWLFGPHDKPDGRKGRCGADRRSGSLGDRRPTAAIVPLPVPRPRGRHDARRLGRRVSRRAVRPSRRRPAPRPPIPHRQDPTRPTPSPTAGRGRVPPAGTDRR